MEEPQVKIRVYSDGQRVYITFDPAVEEFALTPEQAAEFVTKIQKATARVLATGQLRRQRSAQNN